MNDPVTGVNVVIHVLIPITVVSLMATVIIPVTGDALEKYVSR